MISPDSSLVAAFLKIRFYSPLNFTFLQQGIKERTAFEFNVHSGTRVNCFLSPQTTNCVNCSMGELKLATIRTSVTYFEETGNFLSIVKAAPMLMPEESLIWGSIKNF